MSSLSRELVFLILQFLDEEKFKETVHKLEQESGFFFNMKYFEDQVLAGEWDEVERYLVGFTKVDDNRYSMKIFFEIRKQKYLEALDKQDRAKAVDILVKDLKVFASFNEDLYKEITQLLALDNFRENEQLSKYGDTKSARNIMLLELKKLIEANPLFREKLQFPNLKASRLRTLINQSLNWQHQLCKNPRPNPDIKTLFIDHSCGPAVNNGRGPGPNPALSAVPKPDQPFPLGVGPHPSMQPFQPSGPSVGQLAGWMNRGPPPAHNAPPPPGLQPPGGGQVLKRPRTPPGPSGEYGGGESEHLLKRPRPGVPEEIHYMPSRPEEIAAAHAQQQQQQQQQQVVGGYSAEDLPKSVARTLTMASCGMTLDFHPFQQTLLLVGTDSGEVSLWEVGWSEKLVEKPFVLWEPERCSPQLAAMLANDPTIRVNRVVWEPNGLLFGAAFSKHVVQIYTYQAHHTVVQHLEIDAHGGGVNDLAFAHPHKQLCVITCGDDKSIKVWDAATGRKQYTFEGHEAPVYSVCPHLKENIQFIFSTAIDGKIKAWLYDHLGSRVDYDAPGKWCTTMAYSADGTRLFSCGTSKDGDSSLVEWNESEGAIKRSYNGFRKRSLGVIQFDTVRNRFLAAGDEFQIKYWDMDNTAVFKTLDADGGLPASPRVRFNKEGSLLAVTSTDNGIKILANEQGGRLLQHFEAARAADRSLGKGPALSSGQCMVPIPVPSPGPDRPLMPPGKPPSNLPANGMEASKPEGAMVDISDAQACRSTRLPDTLAASKVARLIYTNSGVALLALASNAVHKLWKWQRNDRNPAGKATASCAPQLWQPQSGHVMANDVSKATGKDALPCIALSKNDSYVMSASGGKVSLFNMLTFKMMTTFMPPPPAATFLAFHPQDNNIIAIGMEDCSIQIYNVRLDEVKSKLKGHSKRITGLAFSNALNILVSAGADAQLVVWSTDGWEKRKTRMVLGQRAQSGGGGETRVQFHNDQLRLLVVHDSMLAIFDAAKLERTRQWVPKESGFLSSAITAATYSCDSAMVFAGFMDGSVAIFDSEMLRPRCRVAPAVYLSPGMSSIHPVVIAAHPSEACQFALGLSDGGVSILEPLESDGKWAPGMSPENGVPSSGPSTASQGGAASGEGGNKGFAKLEQPPQ